VSTACVGCLHPPAFQPNAVMQFSSGPSMQDYATVPCALPLSVQVTTADGAHAKAGVDVPAVQQGAYTLLVRPPPRALLTLLTDAPPGGGPYTPLLVAVGMNNLDAVKLLLARGANPALRTGGKANALQLARSIVANLHLAGRTATGLVPPPPNAKLVPSPHGASMRCNLQSFAPELV
jgi:hypothetical protein